MGAFWIAFFIYAIIFGVAAGVIRSNQGGEFGGGFLWGFFLGLIGLIVVAATKPKPASTAPLPVGPPTSAPAPTPGAGTNRPPIPQAVRECPHCKEAMRRDASVCPHCRRESDAWRYWEGRWWSPAGTGDPVWYDESAGTWRDVSELPVPEADTFDVVVASLSHPKNTTKIARSIADTSGESVAAVIDKLSALPATVLAGAGYATAEGMRLAIVGRGAQAERRPHEVRVPTPPPA